MGHPVQLLWSFLGKNDSLILLPHLYFIIYVGSRVGGDTTAAVQSVQRACSEAHIIFSLATATSRHCLSPSC